jgi:hypothetical protein
VCIAAERNCSGGCIVKAIIGHQLYMISIFSIMLHDRYIWF